jgi:hypothetical protein
MTVVRIAGAQPHIDTRSDGGNAIGHILVVLADEPGHRAMGLWLRRFRGAGVSCDAYRGTTVTLRAEVRARGVADHAELHLAVVGQADGGPAIPLPGPGSVQRVERARQQYGQAITGSQDWTCYELTAEVPAGAVQVESELTLTGPGEVGLRNVELTRAGGR